MTMPQSTIKLRSADEITALQLRAIEIRRKYGTERDGAVEQIIATTTRVLANYDRPDVVRRMFEVSGPRRTKHPDSRPAAHFDVLKWCLMLGGADESPAGLYLNE